MLQQYGITVDQEAILLSYAFVHGALHGHDSRSTFLRGLTRFEKDLKSKGVTDDTIRFLRMNAYAICKRKGYGEMNLHEQVLGFAILHDAPDATTAYELRNGQRILAKLVRSDQEYSALIAKFKKDPYTCLRNMRNAMLQISRDSNLDKAGQDDRLKRYLEDYFHLMCLLDAHAFPKRGLSQGIPNYIPDFFSDNGKEEPLEPQRRSREKIRIDKMRMFMEAKVLFLNVFRNPNITERTMLEFIMYWVHRKFPYAKKHRRDAGMFGQSIMLSDVQDRTVCRHHALYTVVFAQALGLPARLLKCYVSFGDERQKEAHSCAFISLNGHWHIVDTTNPHEDGGEVKYSIFRVKEQQCDLTNTRYRWTVKAGNRNWTYESHGNMFHRVR